MDKALLDRVEKQSWFHRYPRGWPFLLFVLASIGTIVSVMAIERADDERRQVELERNFTEIAAGIERRASENVMLLRAGAALFETQKDVTESQFNDFAAGLNNDHNLHGSLGMGWAPLLRRNALPYFEIATRAADQSDFMVYPRPDPVAQVVVPIVYLVPATEPNRRAIGYDMYSEQARRDAINLSIQQGKPIASGLVHLVQSRENPDDAGFLIYMPVYADAAKHEVKGFVYSPFRASDFLDSAAELYRSREVGIAIYDNRESPDSLLARRGDMGGTPYTLSRKIDVAGRTWILRVDDSKPSRLTSLSRVTLFFGAIAALLVMAIGRLITRRAAEDRRVLEWLQSQAAIRDSLTRELNHRVKNTLANVLSIAALTRRRSRDQEEFYESFADRIRALSATHDLLAQSNWRNAPLGEIVRSELAPYMQGEAVVAHLDGPDILLGPNDAMSLGLAIHELATNAAKYGALSVSGGQVHVAWEQQPGGEVATVRWREEGGPLVSEPTRRGFGRDLIEKIVAHELGSQVELVFAPEGVRCVLQVPVRVATEFSLRTHPKQG